MTDTARITGVFGTESLAGARAAFELMHVKPSRSPGRAQTATAKNVVHMRSGFRPSGFTIHGANRIEAHKQQDELGAWFRMNLDVEDGVLFVANYNLIGKFGGRATRAIAYIRANRAAPKLRMSARLLSGDLWRVKWGLLEGRFDMLTASEARDAGFSVLSQTAHLTDLQHVREALRVQQLASGIVPAIVTRHRSVDVGGRRVAVRRLDKPRVLSFD